MATKFELRFADFLTHAEALRDQDHWMNWLADSILLAVTARNIAVAADPRVNNQLMVAYGHAVLYRLTEAMDEREWIPQLAGRVAAAVEAVVRETTEAPDLFIYIQTFIARHRPRQYRQGCDQARP